MTATFPLTEQLVRATYPPDWQQTTLDPTLSTSAHLRRRYLDGLLPRLNAELERASAEHSDDASAGRLLDPWLDDPQVLKEHSPAELLQALRDGARAALADPSSVAVLAEDDVRPVRVSRFFDEHAYADACNVALGIHAEELRAWEDRFDGSLRRHLHVDVGRPIGKVLERRSGAWTEVSGVAVVLALVSSDGPALIYDAYPEVALDQTYRERFPMLPHLFGAYFGDVPDRPWSALVTLQRWTFGPAKEQVTEQLAALLELDDGEIRHAVEAFGSHLLPSVLRAWVESIAFRLEKDVVVDENGEAVDLWAMYGPDRER